MTGDRSDGMRRLAPEPQPVDTRETPRMRAAMERAVAEITGAAPPTYTLHLTERDRLALLLDLAYARAASAGALAHAQQTSDREFSAVCRGRLAATDVLIDRIERLRPDQVPGG